MFTHRTNQIFGRNGFIAKRRKAARLFLQDGFFASAHAVCANVVRGSVVVSRWLVAIHKATHWQLVQNITLKLSFLLADVSHFFFQLGMTICDVRMGIAQRKQAVLQIKDD